MKNYFDICRRSGSGGFYIPEMERRSSKLVKVPVAWVPGGVDPVQLQAVQL